MFITNYKIGYITSSWYIWNRHSIQFLFIRVLLIIKTTTILKDIIARRIYINWLLNFSAHQYHQQSDSWNFHLFYHQTPLPPPPPNLIEAKGQLVIAGGIRRGEFESWSRWYCGLLTIRYLAQINFLPQVLAVLAWSCHDVYRGAAPTKCICFHFDCELQLVFGFGL